MWIIDFYKLEEYPKNLRSHLTKLLDSVTDININSMDLFNNPIVSMTLIEYGVLVEEEEFKKKKTSKERKRKINKILDKDKDND